MLRLLILLLLPFILFAYSEERVKSNLSTDYAECAAYYMISAGGVKELNKELEKKSNSLALKMFENSILFSNEKTAKSRVILYMEEQKKEMDYHYSNFSRLMLKYGNFCKELYENPEQRIKYWHNKKD
jgi:hypothetical protein